MATLEGRPVFSGIGKGPAIVTKRPVNFTASFTKPLNLVPGRRSMVMDRHHDLFKTNIKGSVLIFPACIGSTYTGMILLELMYNGVSPAAIIVQRADPLLVSGTVLADVWFQCGVPIVEYRGDDIYEKIETGDRVEVDGATGEIKIGGSGA